MNNFNGIFIQDASDERVPKPQEETTNRKRHKRKQTKIRFIKAFLLGSPVGFYMNLNEKVIESALQFDGVFGRYLEKFSNFYQIVEGLVSNYVIMSY